MLKKRSRNPRLTATCAWLVACAPVLAAAPATQPGPTDVSGLAARAMQVLRNNCVACHNPEKHKGALVLTSLNAALKGNDDGPALTLHDPAHSRMIAALDAEADPHMPPKKQLADEDATTLHQWIEAGAPWDDRALSTEPATTRPIAFQALPASYHPVLALALSPDDKRLAVGRGNQVLIYNVEREDKPVMVLEGVRDAVQALAWSADDKWLAAGDFGRAIVWDRASPGAPKVLEGLSGRVTALVFAGDGATLFVADGGAGSPARIVRYQLPDASPRATIIAHPDSIFCLRRTRDGAVLASGGADKLVKLWKLPELAEIGRLEGHSGHVLSLAFNPDDSLLASSSADREIKVWDLKTREQKQTIGPGPAAVTAIAWGTGEQIAAADEDGLVRLDRSSAPDLGSALPPAADALYAITMTSDGKRLYAGCHDGQVYVWETSGKLIGKLPAVGDGK